MYVFYDKKVTFNFYLARQGNFKQSNLGWFINIYKIPKALEGRYT